MNKICCDCNDGEHENYDDDVQLVAVIDPDTRKEFKKGFMCNEHREMYLSDGYRLIHCFA